MNVVQRLNKMRRGYTNTARSIQKNRPFGRYLREDILPGLVPGRTFGYHATKGFKLMPKR